MSKLLKISTVAVVVVFMVSDVYAKTVSIGGTHSRAEIGKKCDAVGGVKVGTGAKSGGFGCENLDKGTSVNCNSKGQCTGWVPS